MGLYYNKVKFNLQNKRIHRSENNMLLQSTSNLLVNFAALSSLIRASFQKPEKFIFKSRLPFVYIDYETKLHFT